MEKNLSVNKINDYKMPLDNIFIIAVNYVLTLMLVYIFFDLQIESNDHPLYNAESILIITFSSILNTFMSAHRSPTLKITSVLLIFFYIQRVIFTYFFVDEFYYINYLSFTTDDIEATSKFFLYCVASILAGKYLLQPFLLVTINKFFCSRVPDYVNIRYFFFKVNFNHLSRFVAYFCLAAFALKISIVLLYSKYTGVLYSKNEVIIMWLMGFANSLSLFVIFAIIYFSFSKKKNRIFKIVILFIVLGAILFTSKGVLLTFVISAYVCYSVLKKKISLKLILIGFLAVLMTVFIIYPLFATLRTTFSGEGFNFNTPLYLSYMQNAFFSFSNRLGGFDWLNLWISVPFNEIPSSASLLGDIIRTINMLLPGELISQPDYVSLAKLQVVLGRGYESSFINQLGGHAETLAGLATAYVYFGILLAPLFFLIWSGLLTAIESSRIHPFHKVSILSSYLIVFLTGGGFILMHGSFFWFLFCTIFLSGIIWVVGLFKKMICR